MARVALPDVPVSGRELEDYVAGMLQAAGYFVEKNIRQREVTDVLELDAVATSYDDPLPTLVLAEAKGGRWGFPDIFKVAGWMAYLGIRRGGFFVKEGNSTGARDVKTVKDTVATLGVSLVDLGDFRDPASSLSAGGFRGFCDPLLLDIWRFSFWVERALLDGLRQERRADPSRRGPQQALLYHDLINDHIFFLKDRKDRLRRLYDAYRSHPKLSASIAAAIAGERFKPPALAPASARVLAEAMYEGKHAVLQGSFYLEHRARLSILKTAIDLACDVAAGMPLGQDASSTLPATFREGLRRLRERPSHRRYALLWQVFLWGFGGFYLADHEPWEFAQLAKQTGIPRAEIAEGLRAFDDIFPLTGGSWIVPVKGTSLRVAKMVPAAFRGVGAVQRLRRFGARNYDGFGFNEATRRNLITWHNAMVRLLSASSAQGAAPNGKPSSAHGPASRS